MKGASRPDRTRVLVVRSDNLGDVLLAGPAVRAVAASAEVVVLTSPQGRAAAELLPGVARTLTFRTPWIDAHPPPVGVDDVDRLLGVLRRLAPDAAASCHCPVPGQPCLVPVTPDAVVAAVQELTGRIDRPQAARSGASARHALEVTAG